MLFILTLCSLWVQLAVASDTSLVVFVVAPEQQSLEAAITLVQNSDRNGGTRFALVPAWPDGTGSFAIPAQSAANFLADLAVSFPACLGNSAGAGDLLIAMHHVMASHPEWLTVSGRRTIVAIFPAAITRDDTPPAASSKLLLSAADLTRDSVTIIAHEHAFNFLGDPGLADAYGDGRHFNKAGTITALAAHNLGHSLQAKLLRGGLAVRVLSRATLSLLAPPALNVFAWADHLFSPRLAISQRPPATPTAVPRMVVQDGVAGDLRQLLATNVALPKHIRHPLPRAWPAMQRWNTASYLADLLAPDDNDEDVLLQSIKVGSQESDGNLFMDPDPRAPLHNFTQLNLGYTLVNMTATSFLEGLISKAGEESRVYFTPLPEVAKPDLEPFEPIFFSDEDVQLRKQFLWISSAKSTTHTHFDQDYNVFCQVLGKKRFTLFMPEDGDFLYVYPRVHPLWHKSQVDIINVNTALFPNFARANPITVDVEPGDLLYIPPYVWHRVETIEGPSVSVASLSHDNLVRTNMDAVYNHDHKFDLVQNRTGKLFALRLYLDLAVGRLYGDGLSDTLVYFQQLVERRFAPLRGLFAAPASNMCDTVFSGKIPVARHVYIDCAGDVALTIPAFQELAPAVRDLLFADYVEEIAAQVVGATHVLAFFEQCFNGQNYKFTDPKSELHDSLWRYYDEKIDGALD